MRVVSDARHPMLTGLNDLPPPIGAGEPITLAFERQAAATPDRYAILCGDRSLSYGELNQRANQLGHTLRGAGVRPNDRVAVYLERSPDIVVALLGILKAGGCCVPIDCAYPSERIGHIIADAAAAIVLTREELQGNLQPQSTRVICLDRDWPAIAASASNDNPDPGNGSDDLIYCIFTSGSTGRPKGAGVRHRGFANLVHWYVGEFGMTSEDKVLLLSSFGFDLTQKNIFSPFVAGATLVVPDAPRNEPLYLQDVIARHAVSWVNCAPSMFYLLLEGKAHADKLSSLRYVFLGGEPIDPARLEPWLETTECCIVNTYGPTECTDIAAFHRIERMADYRERKIPIGRPIPGAMLYVVDETLQQVAVGTAGELCIAGIGVGAGYLGDPAKTAAKFVDNRFACADQPWSGSKMYRTGDLVRCLPNGEIEFIDRLDNQTKIGGQRIELGEIETALNASVAVSGTVVLAKDNAHGKFLVAYVVPQAGMQPSVESLQRELATRLPAYMIPPTFLFLDRFPLNPNGKIDRHALPEPARDRMRLAQSYQPPRDELEAEIMHFWSELLDIDRVGVHDRFFELGGNSIRAAQFVTRLSEHLGEQIPIMAVFNAPTIADVAAVLRQEYAPLIDARYGVGSAEIGMNRDENKSQAADPFARLEARAEQRTSIQERQRVRREARRSRRVI